MTDTTEETIKQQHRVITDEPWVWRKAMAKADLPASAYKVGIMLADEFLNKKSGDLFPSYDTIARACGIPLGTVRKGIDALRKSGLLFTKKIRFDGSLNFFLALPGVSRNVQFGTLREQDEVSNLEHTKRSELSARNVQSRTHETFDLEQVTYRIEPIEGNLSTEPTDNRTSGPADDASGALRFAPSVSSLRSDKSASVARDPESANGNTCQKDGTLDEDDIPFVCPSTYQEQSALIGSLTGKRNGQVLQNMLSKLRDGQLTPRKARDILAEAGLEVVS